MKIARRALIPLMLLAATTLSSCQFCYDEGDLVGVYRARRTAIEETLTLHPGGVYVHQWRSGQGVVSYQGNWRAEFCSIELRDYIDPRDPPPGPDGKGGRLVRFHGGPLTLWWWGGPTIFSDEPDVDFIWRQSL